MSFLYRTRLFGKSVKLSNMGGFIFDILLILFIWIAYFVYSDLKNINDRLPIVSIPASDFALVGALGIYSIRIAMYIAILRKNGQPQVLEWLVFLIPMALALPLFLASGQFVKLYARSNGYKFCFEQVDRSTIYTFALSPIICPLQPVRSERHIPPP